MWQRLLKYLKRLYQTHVSLHLPTIWNSHSQSSTCFAFTTPVSLFQILILYIWQSSTNSLFFFCSWGSEGGAREHKIKHKQTMCASVIKNQKKINNVQKYCKLHTLCVICIYSLAWRHNSLLKQHNVQPCAVLIWLSQHTTVAKHTLLSVDTSMPEQQWSVWLIKRYL